MNKDHLVVEANIINSKLNVKSYVSNSISKWINFWWIFQWASFYMLWVYICPRERLLESIGFSWCFHRFVYCQLGLKPKAGTKKLLLSVNLQWSFYAVSIKSLKPLLHIAQWFHFIIVLPFYQYQWTISGRIFESITLLRICAGQHKHAECLNFSFSPPERPYVDQQIRETSELPEGRPPCSSTEPFCRHIFTQADTFILILLQMIFTHLILLK